MNFENADNEKVKEINISEVVILSVNKLKEYIPTIESSDNSEDISEYVTYLTDLMKLLDNLPKDPITEEDELTDTLKYLTFFAIYCSGCLSSFRKVEFTIEGPLGKVDALLYAYMNILSIIYFKGFHFNFLYDDKWSQYKKLTDNVHLSGEKVTPFLYAINRSKTTIDLIISF